MMIDSLDFLPVGPPCDVILDQRRLDASSADKFSERQRSHHRVSPDSVILIIKARQLLMKHFYPFLFVFLWSTGFVSARWGLPFAEPLSFLLVRYLCVIVLMFTIALLSRAPWPKDLRQWGHISVSGVLIHATYLGGVFIAIKQGLPAGITALVVGMQPLLTAVGAGALLGERVNLRQWGGLVLGFIGLTLVVSGKFGVNAELGPMLIPAIVALVGMTAGTLYQKRFCAGFDLGFEVQWDENVR